jgi:hypothetical protein
MTGGDSPAASASSRVTQAAASCKPPLRWPRAWLEHPTPQHGGHSTTEGRLGAVLLLCGSGWPQRFTGAPGSIQV